MFEKIPESIFDKAGHDDTNTQKNVENIIRVNKILEEKIADINDEISVSTRMFEASQRKLDEEDDISLRDKYDSELKELSLKIKDLQEEKESLKKQIYIRSDN